MSEVKKIATRVSYGETLCELGADHSDIVVLDADLAGSTMTGMFKKAFPERFFDCGIAEANMIGVAAGLASTGKTVFASSFAMFAVGRAFEQIRNSIAYPQLNVKICASHAGITVGEDGASHQCLEDISLMRTLPNMVVMNPSDDIQARAAIKAAYAHKGPVYIRLARAATPVINDPATFTFEIGKGVRVTEGTDVTILATGICVGSAVEAAKLLKEQGISAEVIDLCTIKPLDEEMIIESAKKTGKVVTVEEGFAAAGFGGAVAELLSEKCPTRLKRLGMQDHFGESGPANDLMEKYGLDGKGVAASVAAFVKG